MLYLLAILLPPLAVLCCGRVVLAIITVPLTIMFWFPGAIIALFVVAQHHANQRTDRVVHAIHASSAASRSRHAGGAE